MEDPEAGTWSGGGAERRPLETDREEGRGRGATQTLEQ